MSPGNKSMIILFILFLISIPLMLFTQQAWIIIVVFVLFGIIATIIANKEKVKMEHEMGLKPGEISNSDMRMYFKDPSQRDSIIEKYARQQGYTDEQIQEIMRSQNSVKKSESLGSFEAPPVAKGYEPESAAGRRSRIDTGSVEVTVQSMENNTSFTFNIDGRVIGYIGPQRSVLTVPSGMHQVTIVTSDMNRKQIYSENILFNTNKSFTVKKKFGGYSVSKN